MVVRLDTTAPAVATAGLTPGTPSDTGTIGDAITSNPSPAISGTGNPGDTITLFAANGTTVLGTALISAAGTWSVDPAGNYLSEGLNALSIRATDPAGNVGAALAVVVRLDASVPPVAVTDDLVYGGLFESNMLNPTEILPRANTGLHVQQTVNSTLLLASNNPGMRLGEVDSTTAAELAGALGDDLFVVMDTAQSESTNLTDLRKHTGKGLEIQQSSALFVTQAVHQLALSNDHLTLVHHAVRTSQVEAAARAAMVQVASNSALVGTSTLFDPFALGAPQQVDASVTAIGTVQAEPSTKATTADAQVAQLVALETTSSDSFGSIIVLPKTEISVLPARRAASGFSNQIKHSAAEFQPRRAEPVYVQTGCV